MQHQTVADPQIEVYRRMAPWQRLEAARQLYWFAREIIVARERRAHPEASEAEIEQKVRASFR